MSDASGRDPWWATENSDAAPSPEPPPMPPSVPPSAMPSTTPPPFPPPQPPAAPTAWQPAPPQTPVGSPPPGSSFPPPPPGPPLPPGAWPTPPPGQPQPVSVYGLAPQRKRSRLGVVVGIIVALALLATAGGVVAVFLSGDSPQGVIRARESQGSQSAEPSIRDDAPQAEVDIIGATGSDLNEIMAAAIADLENYWSDQFPRLFDAPYQPIAGGFYAWSPGEALPQCVDSPDQLLGNAYYCGEADEVAWDDAEFMPYIHDTFGDFAVAVVLAHEWGHAVQARVGYSAESVTFEQQADCYAGAWVASTLDGESEFFQPDAQAIDYALAGFLELGDAPGSSALDPMAHGSSFDRVNSFQEGFESGNDVCAQYTDDNVLSRIVQIPFLTVDDLESGGNAAYDEIFPMIDADLNDYWSLTAADYFDGGWTDLAAGTPFDSTFGVECDGTEVNESPVFYCAPERTVYYDDEDYMPTVYEGYGDFGVALEYAIEFNIGALSEFDAVPDDLNDRLSLVECLAGSWTASIFMEDRETSEMRLSAGDFDEALKVIIASNANADPGSAFEGVRSFRNGVMGGADACLND